MPTAETLPVASTVAISSSAEDHTTVLSIALSGETVAILPTGIEVITEDLWSEYGLEAGQKAKRGEQLNANIYLTLTKDGWKIVRIGIDRYIADEMTPAESREE